MRHKDSEDTSVLSKHYQLRPTPMNDTNWRIVNTKLLSFVNFFMPDRLFNIINRHLI